jgi:hypothetical protein
MGELAEYVDGLPNLCGSEQLVEAAVAASRGQPLIPSAGSELRTAAVISSLQ